MEYPNRKTIIMYHVVPIKFKDEDRLILALFAVFKVYNSLKFTLETVHVGTVELVSKQEGKNPYSLLKIHECLCNVSHKAHDDP